MKKILIECVMAESTKFELISRIGAGGMGEVYKARLFNDHGFEKVVAAKRVISPELNKEFLREAELLSKLSHSNICSVFDVKEYEGQIYILMEYIDGYSLSQIQDLSVQKGYRFKEKFILSLAYEVLKGLEYAHSENKGKPAVVHRDISPQNIMVSHAGQVKILDFGIARIERTDLSYNERSTYGKIRYCAPEILKGQEYSERSDLYALGIVLLEFSIGAKVFDDLSESQIIAKKLTSELDYSLLEKRYSVGLMTFIEKLTLPDKNNRFECAIDALSFLRKRDLIEADFPTEVLISEIDTLKKFEADHTKTVQVPVIKAKSRQYKSVISMISIILILACGVMFYFYPKQIWQPIEIKIWSDGKLVSLNRPELNGHIEVGGETGVYLTEHSCVSAINQFLDLPSFIFDPNIEKSLEFLGAKKTPNEFLSMLVNDGISKRDGFNILRKNCQYSKIFNTGAVIYEDLQSVLYGEALNQVKTYSDLNKLVSQKVMFSTQKALELKDAEKNLISSELMLRLLNQLETIKKSSIPTTAGFTVLSLDENIFPRSLKECRALLEQYWVREIIVKYSDLKMIMNFSAILLPLPYHGEISKYGPFFLELKDNLKSEESTFRSTGICIYQRFKGEVVESSLRKL